MIINLTRAKPSRESSTVYHPYTISVDADIPHGSEVILAVEGVKQTGQLLRQNLLNPRRAVIPTVELRRLQIGVRVQRGRLCYPFIYAVVLEAKGRRLVYDAKALFDAKEESPSGSRFHLTEPEFIEEIDRFAPNIPADGRPYLSLSPLPGAVVTKSKIQSPFVVDVDGGGFSDSSIRVEMSGEDGEGRAWHHSTLVKSPVAEDDSDDKYSTTREELPIASWGSIAFGLELKASSNGHHAPHLGGIAVEGDGRRFFMSAASFIDSQPDAILDDSMSLMRFSNTRGSVLTLKHQLPEFSGFPTVLERLHEMFQNGGFVPDWARDQVVGNIREELE